MLPPQTRDLAKENNKLKDENLVLKHKLEKTKAATRTEKWLEANSHDPKTAEKRETSD